MNVSKGKDLMYMDLDNGVKYNLTSRRRQNHVRVFGVGCNLRNPAIVATEGSS